MEGAEEHTVQKRKMKQGAKCSTAREIKLLNEFAEVSKGSLQHRASKTGMLKGSDGVMRGDKEVPYEVCDCSDNGQEPHQPSFLDEPTMTGQRSQGMDSAVPVYWAAS